MAGETVSLDYTPATVDAAGNHQDSETPLYPGLQLVNTAEGWVVRKVTLRSNERDARRGIAEETVTYPGHFATQEDALAAAADHYAKDGAGDVGADKALADYVSQSQARGTSTKASAQAS